MISPVAAMMYKSVKVSAKKVNYGVLHLKGKLQSISIWTATKWIHLLLPIPEFFDADNCRHGLADSLRRTRETGAGLGASSQAGACFN